MMNNTTDRNDWAAPRRTTPWGRLTLVALVLHGAVLLPLWKMGFFERELEIDREEARQMADEAEKRARERRERELHERKDRELREEDREHLAEHEHEQARQALAAYVEELQRIDEEMEQLAEDSLEDIEARDSEAYERYQEAQAGRGLDALDMEGFNDVSSAERGLDQDLHPPSLEGLDPEALFEMAEALQQAVNSNFDEMRAAQLAQRMDLPFAEAMENLVPGKPPESPPIDFAGMEMDPQTFADLQALQQAMAEASNQAGQMAAAAGQQLAQAQGMAGPPGMLPGMPGMLPGMGAGMGSNPFAMGMPSDMSGVLDLRRNLDLRPQFSDSRLSGANERDQTGQQAEGGALMARGTLLPEVDIGSREHYIHANALPGHRFSRDSERAGWVYLNTFYTIGPWDNHGRIDWDHLHGPDPQPFMAVDLDARYLDGATRARDGSGAHVELSGELTWRFVQTDAVRMTFPDEIADGTYYAYTEVFFEEAMDMDVLIASDDATRAWIANSHYGNGFLFHTEDQLSSWELGEARKRMHFTAGLNRILIRLENGPSFARLSVLLSPVAALDATQ